MTLRAIEQRDVLRGVQIQPEKAVCAEIVVQIADILRRILAAGGAVDEPVAPVEFHKAAAAPEVRLPVDARRDVRTELLFAGNVLRRVSRADIDRQEGADQAGAQAAVGRKPGRSSTLVSSSR